MGLVFYRAQTQWCWRSRADLSSPWEFDGNFPSGRNYLEMKQNWMKIRNNSTLVKSKL